MPGAAAPGPSSTALLIARSLVFSSGDDDLKVLIPDESLVLASAAVATGSDVSRRLLHLLCRPGMRWLVRLAERLLLPGIQRHYILRKRFIADAAERAIAAGVRQVVVLGAGLDGTALRLSRRPERVACFEVDHPATQAVKLAALARAGLANGSLRLVAADLSRQRLPDVLPRAGFDTSVPTFFVVEGLTMYLQEQSVRTLLANCHELAPSGSRLVWTFMEPDERGRLAFRPSRRGLVDLWLHQREEPFTWGIRREAVSPFVEPLGFGVEELVDDVELRSRYGVPADRSLASGELLCILTKP